MSRAGVRLAYGSFMRIRDREDHTERASADRRPRDHVQEHVNTYFDSAASYWDGVYRDGGLQGLIYRERQAAVLREVDGVKLAPGARVLEIGCGAGHLTVRLAERRLKVDALDASEAMVQGAAGRARAAGLGEMVNVAVADVHTLPFASGEFDLVVAVGVLPWLHSPEQAIAEMARVLRGDGQLILTADNRARLTSFTDPREALAQTPLRRIYHAIRKRPGVAMSRLDSPRRVDRLLLRGGLVPLARGTVGFGPMTFLGRAFIGGARGIRLNNRLQGLADRDTPGVRWTGWHYVVRARKLA
jgi:ubiquinone/menaquinone biosynthesis C-methylase UbiE